MFCFFSFGVSYSSTVSVFPYLVIQHYHVASAAPPMQTCKSMCWVNGYLLNGRKGDKGKTIRNSEVPERVVYSHPPGKEVLGFKGNMS